MPADVYDYVLDRLRDNRALTFCQRRMFDQRELYERILFAPRPVAVKILRHLENLVRIHVACNHQRRIVRYVVTRLYQAHHGSGCSRNRLPVAEWILTAGVFRKHPIRHLLVEEEERIRLVPVNLADDHLALAFKLTLFEQRIAY